MKPRHSPIPVLCILLTAGCYGTSSRTHDGGDTSPDPGTDTATDTSSDPEPEPEPDVVPDPAHDVPEDTGTDPGPDPTDAAPDPPPGACGGDTGHECPPGFFCQLPPGVCYSDCTTGVCVEIPTDDCPAIYAPECGCDGVTYSNGCMRLAAGQNLQYEGECEEERICAPWLDECLDGEICDPPPDSCWMIGVAGVCTPIRNDCGWCWDPQCGCDGTTYANECTRMQADVWVDHPGECGPPCGDEGAPPCAPGFFCEFPTGACGPEGMPGECMAIPELCEELDEPVCGCDGVTYSNDCERQAAQAQLLRRGPC
jgi:hypothetical protein